MSVNLNKNDFTKVLDVVGVKVSAIYCNDILSKFKSHMFSRPKMKKVYEVKNEPDKRIILLSEQYSMDGFLSSIPSNLKQQLEDIQAVPVEYKVEITYDLLSADEVLTKLLPPNTEIPSSYEQVGHIAHINLRDNILPYKSVIGQVLLDKYPSLKTVVNKLGAIETEFRTFPMEVFDIVTQYF
jgi:tRNA (guanine37-N1)-methyltransferase